MMRFESLATASIAGLEMCLGFRGTLQEARSWGGVEEARGREAEQCVPKRKKSLICTLPCT
jgi:hypothetical protein